MTVQETINQLVTLIGDNITTNGQQEITGAVHRNVLEQIVTLFGGLLESPDPATMALFPAWSNTFTYVVGTDYIVRYDDKLWDFVKTTDSTNDEPGQDPTEWLRITALGLAHVRNRDTELAQGSTDAVTAAEIREFIDTFTSGGVDGVCTGFTLTGTVLTAARSAGLASISVDLQPLIDGLGGGGTPDPTVIENFIQNSEYVKQVGYVDPTNGDDSTGTINDESLPYATLKGAVDDLTATDCYITIIPGANLVEPVNILTDLSPNVKKLVIAGPWATMSLGGTRPFALTGTNLEEFELNATNGAGTLNCSATSFTVLCEGWTGSVIRNVKISVGAVNFTENANHAVFATRGTKMILNITTRTVTNGGICRLSEGTYCNGDIYVEGNVIGGISTSQSDSLFEYRGGASNMRIRVTGYMDDSKFTDARSGIVTANLPGNDNGHFISLESDIFTNKAHSFGIFRMQDGKLPRYFRYKGRVTGTGSGALFYEQRSEGSYPKTLELEVDHQIATPLLQKGSTGNINLNLINCRTISPPINWSSGKLFLKINGLIVESNGAYIGTFNATTADSLDALLDGVIIKDNNASSTNLFLAPNATGIIGKIYNAGIVTNVPNIADPTKFTIVSYGSAGGTPDLTGYVKDDGTTPFLAPQPGVTPTADEHFTTKGFVESLLAPAFQISQGYGYMYNRFCVGTDTTKEIAPQGFRVPSTADWNTLSTFLGSLPGAQLKGLRIDPDAQPRWDSGSVDDDNEFGFSAYPSGYIVDGVGNGTGFFGEQGMYGTTNFGSFDWNIAQIDLSGSLFTGQATTRRNALALRCVSDTEPTTDLVQDGDGNDYSWVQIGAQYWLQQDLRTKSFLDQTLINFGEDQTEYEGFAGSNLPAATYPNYDANIILANVGVETFVKPDGTVPFTAPQPGVTPTANEHLATKEYVDNNSGGGGSGTVQSVTGTAVNNTDPANPIIDLPDFGEEIAFLALSDSSGTPQTLVNNTPTKVAGQIMPQVRDTHDWYDAANARFTPQVAGWYTIYGLATFAAMFDGAKIITYVYKNGASYAVLGRGANGAENEFVGFAGSIDVFLNGTTDYVELWALWGLSSQGTGVGRTLSQFSGINYFGARRAGKSADEKVLTAPNGDRYQIGVDNAGNLTLTQI